MPSILITGASTGFGRKLLESYLKSGWMVFPLVRNAETIAEITSAYAEVCHPIVGDVTAESIGQEIEGVLQKRTTSLDLLINNAGNIRKNRGFLNTSTDDLKSLFDVHCLGVFRCTKAALPFLRNAPHPVVINITSRWGSIGRTVAGKGGKIYSYQIAKCAQNMLTACLHEELKEMNITVFAIHPGRLKTSVAAPDADVAPEDAVRKLMEWIEGIDDGYTCQYYDLISGEVIEW